jgi:hypothetical protein
VKLFQVPLLCLNYPDLSISAEANAGLNIKSIATTHKINENTEIYIRSESQMSLNPMRKFIKFGGKWNPKR